MSRILILDLASRYGGASERAIGILREMPKGKTALVALKASPVSQRAERCGVKVYTVGRSKFNPTIGTHLRKIVQEHGYQVIDSQNPQSRYWGSFVSARIGVPHVATINSLPAKEYENQVKGHIYKYIDMLSARYTSHFISVSPEIKSELLVSGVVANKITTIMNSISVADIGKSNGDWKYALNIPNGSIVCCALARLIRIKGLKYLIKAFSMVVSDAPHFYCVILGNGELRGVLQRQIASLGLENRIHLLGERTHSDAMAIMQDCDFFVLPSLSEGTPLVLLEAGALGRPIIASAVGGIPEVLTDGINGLLIPPGDASVLADRLLWMVRHPAEAVEMGQRAKTIILDKFSMGPMIDQVRAVYEKAIRGSL